MQCKTLALLSALVASSKARILRTNPDEEIEILDTKMINGRGLPGTVAALVDVSVMLDDLDANGTESMLHRVHGRP